MKKTTSSPKKTKTSKKASQKRVQTKSLDKITKFSLLGLVLPVIDLVFVVLIAVFGVDRFSSVTMGYAARNIVDGSMVPAVRVVADINLRWLLLGIIAAHGLFYLGVFLVKKYQPKREPKLNLSNVGTVVTWLALAEFLALSIGMYDILAIKIFGVFCIGALVATQFGQTKRPGKLIAYGLAALTYILLLQHIKGSLLFGDVQFAQYQWIYLTFFSALFAVSTVLLPYAVKTSKKNAALLHSGYSFALLYVLTVVSF